MLVDARPALRALILSNPDIVTACRRARFPGGLAARRD